MEISTLEAAARLGVSQERVGQMLRQGTLDGRRLGPRSWLVDLDSVHQRARLAPRDGRPWSRKTVDDIIASMSSLKHPPARTREIISRTSTDDLWRKIAQIVEVRRFSPRDLAAASRHLALTGPSALSEIGDELVGAAKVVHGYPKGMGLNDLIEVAELVEDPEGKVAVHHFLDGPDPWRPQHALIAVDCARDSSARVRQVGMDALERMRSRWPVRNT
ncbi:hypothetical protein DVJ78_16880 [Humibacter sp. BT305]|nr:hypothetical protein DVJ78_16880 [Humibacter sp. BT305]